MKRRGRKRKLGRRHPNGKLVQARHASPAVIAAAMPHRRGCGEHAVNQLAETALGRAQLADEIDKVQYAAGSQYAAVWHQYLAVLNGPRKPSGGHGRAFDCGGCLDLTETSFCLCRERQRRWREVRAVLARSGALIEVEAIALYDRELAEGFHATLRLGLDALARHFGLTPRCKSDYRYASSHLTPSPPAER